MMHRDRRERSPLLHNHKITVLILISAVSGLISLSAFAYSITAFRSDVNGRVHRIEESRYLSLIDSCHIIRKIIREAYGNDTRGALRLISESRLTHCRHYAYIITHRPPKKK